jgi:predicted  nucleic acid-binding Zn-ribbon protein
MTPEERFERIEQKIEFIVDQQAQFSIDLQQLREAQVMVQGQIDGLKDSTVAIIGIIGKLAEAQARTEANVAELAEAQARMDVKIAELAAKGAETEERLNIFISVVERYISQQQDGSKPAEE